MWENLCFINSFDKIIKCKMSFFEIRTMVIQR